MGCLSSSLSAPDAQVEIRVRANCPSECCTKSISMTIPRENYAELAEVLHKYSLKRRNGEIGSGTENGPAFTK